MKPKDKETRRPCHPHLCQFRGSLKKWWIVFSSLLNRIPWSQVLQKEKKMCLKGYDLQWFCFILMNINDHDRKLHANSREGKKRYWSIVATKGGKPAYSLCIKLLSNLVEGLPTWKWFYVYKAFLRSHELPFLSRWTSQITGLLG